MKAFDQDFRVVLTLDAGGTSFRFSAMRGNRRIVPTFTQPSYGDQLDRCLDIIIEGFKITMARCPAKPVAISFAFPGPADYPNGIIGDLGNLPGFRGGIALGPMLEDIFGIPVFINNDGDLFTYGEAIAGLLPHINGLLEEAGSPKRYRNLFGVTLGTGFGGGIVRDGGLFLGDNSTAAEVWLLRNKLEPEMNAEEGTCIRAVRRFYAQAAGIPFDDRVPDPREIEKIARGGGDASRNDSLLAAIEAYRRLGEVVGDALGNALTLIDGLAVIGGGLSKGHRLFLPAVVDELNGLFVGPNGNSVHRLGSTVFNLEDPDQLQLFLASENREIKVPRTGRKVQYDASRKIGVGLSRLGTSEAVAIGAYAFALCKLDQKLNQICQPTLISHIESKIETKTSKII